jgi:hypothetical protein
MRSQKSMTGLTYPWLIRRTRGRKKKYEELKKKSDGIHPARQDGDPRALEQVREAGGGHKGSQTSAGRCCHTAWLELKNGEQDFHMGFSMWGHSKVFHLIVQDVQDLSVHSFSWSMAEGVWDLLSEWKRIKYSVSMVRRYKRERI